MTPTLALPGAAAEICADKGETLGLVDPPIPPIPDGDDESIGCATSGKRVEACIRFRANEARRLSASARLAQGPADILLLPNRKTGEAQC